MKYKAEHLIKLMYKQDNKIKKLILPMIGLFGIYSCGAPDLKIPIETKSLITVLFNNAYKGLVTDNEALAKKDPNNPDKKFIEIVKAAKTSIDGAFYDIENMDFTNALVDAQKRKVKVRIVTDSSNMKKDGQTRPSIKLLTDSGIVIKEDKKSSSMHHKFMIIDNKYVWTGSMNLTTNSIYHHNNDSILIESDKLAANYNAEFVRMYDKGNFNANPHEMPNPVFTLADGTIIKTFFSPGGKTEAEIIKQIKEAKKSIRFMAFAFTSKSISEAIIAKSKQNVSCEGVLDSCQINKYSVYSNLKDNKITVYKDGNQALMHEKIMVIDNETVITGSYNFSNNAENSNNENTVIIKSVDLAQQYTKEYERLKTASINNKNLPAYDHPACKNNSVGPEYQ